MAAGSSDRTSEGVAVGRPAAVEPGGEPVLPLRRRAVRPLLRLDLAGAELLKEVIAGRRGRRERFVKIAGLEQIAFIYGVSPYPGQAIRLQFNAH